MFRVRMLVLLLAVATAGTMLSQHAYTDEDIAEGGRLYQASCARCHGPQGNNVPNIDLGTGKFRRQLTDADLVRVIRAGIPNSTMVPANISDAQAGMLVAYMRTMMAASSASRPATVLPAGDAARGKTIVESNRGECLRCHRINGTGSRMGPDLTDVGTRRREPEIELALVVPNAEVAPVNRTVRVLTDRNETVTGRLLNHDTLSLLMIDTKEQLRSFQKTNLREWGIIDSPMPSYRSKLTPQELADVISYLVSLKGQVNP